MANYTHRAFTCPWYTGNERRRSDRRMVIRCGGGTRVVFPDRRAFTGYVGDFCAGEGWMGCPIALMSAEAAEREKKREEGTR